MSIYFSYLISILFVFMTTGMKSEYHKEYYETGIIKAEGWIENGSKNGYWKFYHSNGAIAKQGHYKKDVKEKYWYFYDSVSNPIKEGKYIGGRMANWWIFYDTQGRIIHKCQLNKGKKNGYCLKYANDKLVSAEKYKNGTKIKEWFSFADFQRENKLSDLK